MPLIVICGTPLTGKTRVSQEIKSHILNSNPNQNIVVVTDEEKLLDPGPDVIYKNAQIEKDTRSWLKSQVQRNLSSADTVVILDASNYIKGYRYELYCLSKQFKTTYALVECLPPLDSNQLFLNFNRTPPYSNEVFNELLQRYEPPRSSNKWEEPLFRVEFESRQIPLEEIENAIFIKAKLKPNRSTQAVPLTTDNFLFELNNHTKNVIDEIQRALRLNQLENIKISGTDVAVNLNRKVPTTELNKYGRQFINYTRLNPITDKNHIITAFVQFINKSVEL